MQSIRYGLFLLIFVVVIDFDNFVTCSLRNFVLKKRIKNDIQIVESVEGHSNADKRRHLVKAVEKLFRLCKAKYSDVYDVLISISIVDVL